MGLDWNIQINGKDPEPDSEDRKLPCNGMNISFFLDGCTANMVADLGLDPRWPYWPSEMRGFMNPNKNTLDAQDMIVISQLIAQRATCAEHIRIAAWLWSWAEEHSEGYKVTCYISY